MLMPDEAAMRAVILSLALGDGDSVGRSGLPEAIAEPIGMECNPTGLAAARIAAALAAAGRSEAAV